MKREAAEFSTATAYAVGDLCIYGGFLYRFTSAHSASAWDDSDAEKYDSTPENDIERILAGTDNAQRAITFVNSLVMAPTQIRATRYRYVFTNAEDPR